MTTRHVLELADSRTHEDRQRAVEECVRYLDDTEQDPAVRVAAARTLGRLAEAKPEVVRSLTRAYVVSELSEPPDFPERSPLRSMAAWALGRMRTRASLEALLLVLRSPSSEEEAHYVLEALAKHHAITVESEDLRVEVAEALTHFRGNHRGSVPAMYALLAAKTRSVPVDIRVLSRALDDLSARDAKEQREEVYGAAIELLSRLEGQREEIRAGAVAWERPIAESVRQLRRVLDLGDAGMTRVVLFWLGRLVTVPEIARAVHPLLTDFLLRPRDSARESEDLVAVFAAARTRLFGMGPSGALGALLLSSKHEEVIRALADAVEADAGASGFDVLVTRPMPLGPPGPEATRP